MLVTNGMVTKALLRPLNMILKLREYFPPQEKLTEFCTAVMAAKI